MKKPTKDKQAIWVICQSCGDSFKRSTDERQNQKVTLCPECRGWADAYKGK